MSSSIQSKMPTIAPQKLPLARPTPPARDVLSEPRGQGYKRGSMVAADMGSALEAIWDNRLRSLLTALGIFIGVAAVIAALTLTQGVGAQITGRFSSLGTTTITVRNGAANSRGAFGAGGTVQSLTPADANAIKMLRSNVNKCGE